MTQAARTAASTPQTWTTANRPASPYLGQMGWNSTLSQMEIWTGSVWQQSTAVGSAPVFFARAFGFFNGTTNPPTIYNSGNVSGIVKNGTGDYTVTFQTAMPTAAYMAIGNGARFVQVNSGIHTTTQLQILSQNLAGSQSDDGGISFVCFA